MPRKGKQMKVQQFIKMIPDGEHISVLSADAVEMFRSTDRKAIGEMWKGYDVVCVMSDTIEGKPYLVIVVNVMVDK